LKTPPVPSKRMQTHMSLQISTWLCIFYTQFSCRVCSVFLYQFGSLKTYNILLPFADLGEIVRAKFDFDVVGHYARPEVLSLVVNDKPQLPASFTSAAEKTTPTAKSDGIVKSYRITD